MAVLVGEEDHHRETADDDALEDEEDGPEDHVEGDNTGGAVLAVITALSALQTLELCLKVVECQVLSLKQKLSNQVKFYYSSATVGRCHY